MAAINADWNARNALRAHPLDDAATAVDDAGVPLPPDILVDCSIRFPAALGATLFLAGVAASPAGVTLTFQASPRLVAPSLLDPQPPEGPFQPVAAVAVTGRIPVGRAIPVEPAAPGVAGWVVLGPGAGSRTYAGRFSTLEQGAILPARARPRKPPGVRTLGSTGGGLDGLVGLLGDSDLRVEIGDQAIAGEIVRVVFVGLRTDASGETPAKYAGPCGGRPESGTCDPPPLERINEVGPDPAGDLRIRFAGIDAHPLLNQTGGIVLDVPATLEDVCPPRDRLGLDPDTGAPERDLDHASPDLVNFPDAGLDDLRVAAGLFSAGLRGVASRDPHGINLAVRDRARAPRRIVVELEPPELGGFAGIAFAVLEADGPAFLWARIAAQVDGTVQLELASRSGDGEVVAAASDLWSPGPGGPPTAGPVRAELAVSFGEVREDGLVRVAAEAVSAAYSGWVAADLPDPGNAPFGIAARGAPAVFQVLEAADDSG